MNRFLSAVLCAVLLAKSAPAAPAPQVASSAPAVAFSATSVVASEVVSGTASASAESASPTVPYASNNPNRLAWNPDNVSGDPQPIRTTSGGSLGASILGPQNVAIDMQNPDLLAPPTTDAGTVYVFSMALTIHLADPHYLMTVEMPNGP